MPPSSRWIRTCTPKTVASWRLGRTIRCSKRVPVNLGEHRVRRAMWRLCLPINMLRAGRDKVHSVRRLMAASETPAYNRPRVCGFVGLGPSPSSLVSFITGFTPPSSSGGCSRTVSLRSVNTSPHPPIFPSSRRRCAHSTAITFRFLSSCRFQRLDFFLATKSYFIFLFFFYHIYSLVLFKITFDRSGRSIIL